jgi:hypothetical protein
MAKKLGRKPQTLEPFSIEYLESLAEQLVSAAETLRETVQTMRSRDCKEIWVMYPSRINAAEEMSQKVRDLVYKSHMALRAGAPLTQESVSSRSVRRTNAIEEEERAKIAKKQRRDT